MQEMARALDTAATEIPKGLPDGGLRLAAKNWSNFAIHNLDDVLLRKAFDVSIAIAIFCN